MSQEYIEIKGARVNNLKNVDVRIPRDKFVVIAGVSGSGKSSLAFDTLYAEGQRRYVESLSSYARQFLGRMNKPECDFIRGIPPAIAIEQKVIARNPRSTVGTSTEIYEYLRLLFARIGHTYSPISGQEVKKHTTEDVVRCMQQFSEGTKFLVLAPLIVPEGRTVGQQLKASVLQGYSRILANGKITRIDDWLESQKSQSPNSTSDIPSFGGAWGGLYLVIDRLSASSDKETIDRLVDSCETAFFEGRGELRLMVLPSGLSYDFSTRFEADGMTFEEPSDQLFSFNSPAGACPECQGFGKIIGIDEHLVIPNTSRSVYDGCVQPWHGEVLGEWKDWFIQHAAKDDFPIFESYYNLTQQQKDWLWHGLPSDKGLKERPCIDAFFDMVRETQYKIQYRVMLARYRGKTVCPRCNGTRLKPEANYVKIAGRSITDLVEMPIVRLKEWFDQLTSPSTLLPPPSTPHLFIAHEMTQFSPRDVTIFSNCDSVRLTALDGWKTATLPVVHDPDGVPNAPVVFKDFWDFWKAREQSYTNRSWQNVRLVAEGIVGDSVVCRVEKMPSRRSTKLRLYADEMGRQLVADGSDFIVVVTEVTDDNGNVRRLARESITFSVEGEGTIIGDAQIGANPRIVEWGSAPVLIRSTHKAGKITIIARPTYQGTHAPIADTLVIESVAPQLPQCYSDRTPSTLLPPPSTLHLQPSTLLPPPMTEEERRRSLEEVERQQQDFGIKQ